MTDQERGALIGAIIGALRQAHDRQVAMRAPHEPQPSAFNAADLLFTLAFRTEGELRQIAQDSGI